MLRVNIKKLHQNAVIPTYAKPGDAGMDLIAISKQYDEFDNVVYGTGIAIEIPENYVGLIYPRSSICKKDLYLTNHVGVIDSGYRGEIMFKFKTTKKMYPINIYEIGDRIGQIVIMPYPQIAFMEVEDLTDTERGEGGFGSSGN